MQFLKADTQVKVVVGPVVAVGDGFTPVTTLALSTADEAEIMKHDAAAVTSISGNTFAAVTSADGYYNLTITAAQLDTEGMLTVLVNDDSLCLPVRHDFMVVNANVYDSLYGAATTDYLQVDALQLGGSTQSATDLKDFADAGYDPATNKVQGVVLVDTTTTNTDMLAATAIVSAGAINTSSGAVSTVTTVGTTTTNSDMRGTDSALLAASAPTNFGDMSISITTGLVDITQTAADKAWGTASRILTASTNFNDIAATDIVSGGAINTTAGAVDTVTTNTDMRGTDNAALAASGNVGGVNLVTMNGNINDIEIDTTTDIPALINGLADFDPTVSTVDIGKINGSATAAANLEQSALGVVTGSVTGSATTTTMADTGLAGTTNDHYIGRVIVFITGNLKGQATDITDYVDTGRVFTFTAVTTTVTIGDTYVIV